eukprot:365413-Chlamydomonas_euryale.AAC.5
MGAGDRRLQATGICTLPCPTAPHTQHHDRLPEAAAILHPTHFSRPCVLPSLSSLPSTHISVPLTPSPHLSIPSVPLLSPSHPLSFPFPFFPPILPPPPGPA